MLLDKIIVWFFIYSMAGWTFETVRGVCVTSKWENRGFLYGPLCPIYGFGAVAITIIMDCFEKANGTPLTWIQVFLISFFGSIVLEYGTSYIMEKMFHAIWWDYSNMPFNVNGRICLPASLAFGAAGVFIMYGPSVWVSNLTGLFPDIVIEIIALIAVAVVSCDCTLTVSALTDFDKRVRASYNSFNKYMDNTVNEIVEEREAEKEKVKRFIEGEKEKMFIRNIDSILNDTSAVKKGALRRIRRFVPNDKSVSSHKVKNTVLEKIKTAMNTKHYTQK